MQTVRGVNVEKPDAEVVKRVEATMPGEKCLLFVRPGGVVTGYAAYPEKGPSPTASAIEGMIAELAECTGTPAKNITVLGSAGWLNEKGAAGIAGPAAAVPVVKGDAALVRAAEAALPGRKLLLFILGDGSILGSSLYDAKSPAPTAAEIERLRRDVVEGSTLRPGDVRVLTSAGPVEGLSK